jgi:alpha-glucosidase (family GH31 glycosyl hydrolase)
MFSPITFLFFLFPQGKTDVSAYLPNALWYDFYTLAIVPASGKQHTLPAPLDTIPVLIRGGSVIPMQTPNVTTTER